LSYGRNGPVDGKLRTPRIDSTCGKRRIFMRGRAHAPQRYLARVSLSRTRAGTDAGGHGLTCRLRKVNGGHLAARSFVDCRRVASMVRSGKSARHPPG